MMKNKLILLVFFIVFITSVRVVLGYDIDGASCNTPAPGSCSCRDSGFPWCNFQCSSDSDCRQGNCNVDCSSRSHATQAYTNCSSTMKTATGCTNNCAGDVECGLGGWCNGVGACTVTGCNAPTGACYYTCDAGWDNCDANDANGDGCECDTTISECSGGVCKNSTGSVCTSGNDCASQLICIEGYCGETCGGGHNGERCSYMSDNAWNNYGICTHIDSEGTDGCDPLEAVYTSGLVYKAGCGSLECSDCVYGTECDPDSLAGGYSAAGVCGDTGHSTCCNDFGVDSDNVDAPLTCGAESTVCNGNNGYYCDYTGDVSWDAGDTAGTNKYRCDDNDTACIKCDANNKEMTGLSGNEAQLEGDGKCEQACGADAACDEKNPGDDCGTCLKCSSSCQCTDYYTNYQQDSTAPGTCDGAGDYCSSGSCVDGYDGDGICVNGETYSSTADCCKSDRTACDDYGSNTTCTSDGICRTTKCGASSQCNGDAIGACGDSEGDCNNCIYSDCGNEYYQCCNGDCGYQYVDYGCSGSSCWGPTPGSCTDCGYYTCSGGSCTSTCSQACGAPCDSDDDCEDGTCQTDCTCINCFVYGIALDYYTGTRIDGTITVIPVENPGNKTTATITDGEWSINFSMKTKDVEYLTFIVNTSTKTGYNYMKLDNPKGTTMDCSTQNISLSGYSIDINGNPITSGNVKVSALDTDYSNTTTFSAGTWSIDFYPCLVSGKVYTIQILISDNTGKRGETFQTYAAK